MSDINEYLNHVKEEIETSSSDSRSQAINNGMLNLRKKIRDVEVQTEEVVEPEVEQPEQDYDKLALADSAVGVYREKLQEKKEKVEMPSTKASRVNTKARIQSMTGIHSGNTGKTSPVPMDNPAKSGNTKGFDSGNVVIAPLSMEEYKEQVFASFGLTEATHQDGPKPTPKQRRGAVRNIQQNINSLQNKEDDGEKLSKSEKQQLAFQKARQKAWSEGVVEDLEDVLLELDDTSWQSIDKAMRELCREHNITPKELHKQFKAEHGMIPDEWIKQQEVTEDCGWFPLDEMTRINKVGQVYDVTFIFRGGTSRFKFFWPSANRPSKGDMQAAVEKFYPKARLITYYPCNHQDEDNYMVVVPPMTENYEITPEDTWAEMPEELNEIYHQICEEVGEPISAPMDEDGENIILYVEDHDTGEEREVIIEGGLHAWFNKSKSKDGKPGWVQSDGSPCANEKGETKTPKCYSSQRLAGLKRTAEGRKKIRSADARKSRQDPNQQKKSGGAKPTNVRTFKDPKDLKKHPSGDNYKDESFDPTLDEACWKGYEKKGMKTMFGKRYPNCVKKTKKEEYVMEDDMKGMTVKSGHKRSAESGAGLTQKGVEAYRRKNPGSKLKTAVTTPPSKLKPGSKAAGRRKSFCARSRGWTGERGKAARRRWNC